MNHFPSGMNATPIAKNIPTTSSGCKMGKNDVTRCCRNGVSARRTKGKGRVATAVVLCRGLEMNAAKKPCQ